MFASIFVDKNSCYQENTKVYIYDGLFHLLCTIMNNSGLIFIRTESGGDRLDQRWN
jgi:uncharacterized membrane protein